MSSDAGLRRRLEALAGRLGTLLPPHAFVLTRDRLVYVASGQGARDAKGTPSAPSVRAAVLPPGSLRDGPGGIPVAGPGLAEALGSVLDGHAKPAVTAASLSVPDDFVRVVAVDVDPGSEKNDREVGEVLQWKLGRAFGEGAPALRIAWEVAGPAPGAGTRILGIGTPEEAAASWEAAFASRGIRIGALVPEVLAVAPLARSALGGTGLFVWANGGTVSTAFFERGTLRFLRSKPEGDPDEAVHEIRLSASFVAGDKDAGNGAPGELAGPAVAAPASSAVVERFGDYRREATGAELVPLPPFPWSRGGPAGREDVALLAGLGMLAGEE